MGTNLGHVRSPHLGWKIGWEGVLGRDRCLWIVEWRNKKLLRLLRVCLLEGESMQGEKKKVDEK